MTEDANPLIPAGYDVVWSVVAAAVFVLFVAALVSLVRRGGALTAWQWIAWFLLILLVPVAGALAWLTLGRRPDTSASTRPPA